MHTTQSQVKVMKLGFIIPENMQCNTIYLLVKLKDCEPQIRSLWYMLCLHHRGHHRCCMCRWLFNDWKVNNFRLGCQIMTLPSTKLGVITIDFRTFVSGDNLLTKCVLNLVKCTRCTQGRWAVAVHKRRVLPASDTHRAYKQTAKTPFKLHTVIMWHIMTRQYS